MDKIEILINMTKNTPDNPNIWHLLGLEYHEQNAFSEALNAYSNALRFADDDLRHVISSALTRLSSDMQGAQCNTSETNVEPFKLIKGGQIASSNSKVITMPQNKTITFADIGGLESLKETIRMKIIKPFSNPGIFARFNKKIGGGILLYGPPGCGKTFIAKATAGECNAHFTPIHISDILSKYVGESEKNIHDIFAEARRNKPAILFIDEIDTIGYNRSRLSSEHLRPTIDQLLTEIEGIEASTDQLLIIGATNMPWDVDNAFKRPGRFDKAVFVPPPDVKARKTILELKLANKPNSVLNLDLIVEKTEFYSGADLDNLIETATEFVIADIMNTGVERDLTTDDLLKAFDVTRPSTLEWLRTVNNYVTYSNQTGMYDEVAHYLKLNKKR